MLGSRKIIRAKPCGPAVAEQGVQNRFDNEASQDNYTAPDQAARKEFAPRCTPVLLYLQLYLLLSGSLYYLRVRDLSLRRIPDTRRGAFRHPGGDALQLLFDFARGGGPLAAIHVHHAPDERIQFL